jgi:hypothetical protein
VPDETTCGICGVEMLAQWIRMRQRNPRIEVTWQLTSGFCVSCHLARRAAAHEYDLAAAEVRLWDMLGAATKGPGHSAAGASALSAAIRRVSAADELCIRLKIWSAARSTRRPSWFYGDERSNTE